MCASTTKMIMFTLYVHTSNSGNINFHSWHNINELTHEVRPVSYGKTLKACGDTTMHILLSAHFI